MGCVLSLDGTTAIAMSGDCAAVRKADFATIVRSVPLELSGAAEYYGVCPWSSWLERDGPLLSDTVTDTATT